MATFTQRLTRGVAPLTLALIACPAGAGDLPVKGGPGGSYFRSDCSGDYVVGVYVRSGAWIDAIGLKCAPFDRASGTFKRPAWNKPYHGGSGGTMQERLCPPNSVVAGIRYGFTRDGNRPKYLDFIVLACAKMGQGGNVREWTTTANECISTGEGCWSRHPTSNSTGLSFWNPCEGDQVVVGVHGRAGLFVDALGLICGPKPG
jgi:hypothetical protein